MVIEIIPRAVLSVTDQPSVSMKNWRVIELNQHKHLIGFAIETSKVRSTSAIAEVNDRGEVVTESGRAYNLIGEPGGSPLVDLFIAASEFSLGTEITDEFHQLSRTYQ
jgi:hypothetical protein